MHHSSVLTFCGNTCSGKLESGSYCQNSNKGKKERIGRLMIMHANNREDIKTAYAGDIIAIGGLKVGVIDQTCLFLQLRRPGPPMACVERTALGFVPLLAAAVSPHHHAGSHNTPGRDHG